MPKFWKIELQIMMSQVPACAVSAFTAAVELGHNQKCIS